MNIPRILCCIFLPVLGAINSNSTVYADEFSPQQIPKISETRIRELAESKILKLSKPCRSYKGNLPFQISRDFTDISTISWNSSAESNPQLKITSTNKGEFGGDFSITSKENPLISFGNKINVHAIHYFGNGSILAIGGDVHLGVYVGNLWMIRNTVNKIESRNIFEIFEGFPVYLGEGEAVKPDDKSKIDGAIIAIIKENSVQAIISIDDTGDFKVDFATRNISPDESRSFIHESLSLGEE